MIKILTPFIAIFLAFLVAKQFKPESEQIATTVEVISEKPMRIVNQMPREPVEYNKYRVIKPQYDTVSNKPLSAKTKKSMLSAGDTPYGFLSIDYDKPKG